ncbi:hypothetical protein [Streptomyces fradiae]|uniref:hypothetical protein n=1 Tax=Streptomyces fradiae TaxID=1906 RepID=UPI001CCDFD06|nr:hypothetical protein [Streptomyces fradiae]
MPRLLWWGGLTALAVGAVLCVLGWYGASGEHVAERQLPYLASGTVPGAALVVAGAVWTAAALASRGWGGDGGGAWGRGGGAVGGLGAGEGGSSGGAGAPGGGAGGGEPYGSAFRPVSAAPPVRVPDGTLAHRPDCPLVAARPDAVPAGDAPLAPCPVCEPDGGGGAVGTGGEAGEAGGAAGEAREAGGGAAEDGRGGGGRDGSSGDTGGGGPAPDGGGGGSGGGGAGRS